MALFDDRRFLLSHINHSFITGDDTGICEVVMLDEDVFENQHQRCLKLEGQINEKPGERLDTEAYDLDYESELFDSEQGQSYDIASDLDYICHRRRSNTAQRLDRLKKEKINQSRTKTIVWRCNSPTSSQSGERLSQDSPTSTGDNNESNKFDLNDKQLPQQQQHPAEAVRKSRSPPRKSGLSRLLERFPSLPKNPFDEFAQFDGGMSETVPVKKIMIFIAINQPQQQQQMQNNEPFKQPTNNSNEINHHQPTNLSVSGNITDTNLVGGSSNINNNLHVPPIIDNNNMLPQPPSVTTLINNNNNNNNNNNPTSSLQTQPSKPSKQNDGPLEVVIVSTAKVHDLIGLICWQYTNEGREPKLHKDINRFCLRIAEDNGEVDPDFTSLNPKEPLSKFNFPSLALTEKTKERVRSYADQYANGNIYNPRLTMTPNVTTSSTKLSNVGGRLTALTRFIFKDAKLEANQ